MTPLRRKRLLVVAAAAMLLIAAAAFVPWPAWLVYNPSASAPRGWYAQRPVRDASPGRLVFARLPHDMTRFAHQRGYLPQHLSILKRIGAVEGQHVCGQGGLVRIDGRIVAVSRLRDGVGRPLTAWPGCRVLDRGELFLLAPNAQASFDSRYFGPVGSEAVLGEAVPLWTW